MSNSIEFTGCKIDLGPNPRVKKLVEYRFLGVTVSTYPLGLASFLVCSDLSCPYMVGYDPPHIPIKWGPPHFHI